MVRLIWSAHLTIKMCSGLNNAPGACSWALWTSAPCCPMALSWQLEPFLIILCMGQLLQPLGLCFSPWAYLLLAISSHLYDIWRAAHESLSSSTPWTAYCVEGMLLLLLSRLQEQIVPRCKPVVLEGLADQGRKTFCGQHCYPAWLEFTYLTSQTGKATVRLGSRPCTPLSTHPTGSSIPISTGAIFFHGQSSASQGWKLGEGRDKAARDIFASSFFK